MLDVITMAIDGGNNASLSSPWWYYVLWVFMVFFFVKVFIIPGVDKWKKNKEREAWERREQKRRLTKDAHV